MCSYRLCCFEVFDLDLLLFSSLIYLEIQPHIFNIAGPSVFKQEFGKVLWSLLQVRVIRQDNSKPGKPGVRILSEWTNL